MRNAAIEALPIDAQRLLNQRDETGLNAVAQALLKKRFGINPNLAKYGGAGQVCAPGVEPDGVTCDVPHCKGGSCSGGFWKAVYAAGNVATAAVFAYTGAGLAGIVGAPAASAAAAPGAASTGATTFAVTSSAPSVSAVATGGGAFVPTGVTASGALATAGKALSTGSSVAKLLGGSSSAPSDKPAAQADVSPIFSAPWQQPGAASFDRAPAPASNGFPFVLVIGIAIIAIASILLGRK